MVECKGTHHTGCACHEARRDAEIASLHARIERVREVCKPEWIPQGYEPVVTVGRNRLRAEIAALLEDHARP